MATPVTLSGNQATRIMSINFSAVTITNLGFTQGQQELGAAIYQNGGTLIINQTAFTDNHAQAIGGAIVSLNGTLNINNSRFISNTAPSAAGGIYNFPNSNLAITNSTFTGNIGVGGGGAIYNDGYATVDNSTFTNNVTTNGDGGAIGNSRTSLVTNSTFTGNRSPDSRGVGIGGAIGSRGSLLTGAVATIKNSTITGNSDGVASIDNSALHLSNTIIANSTVGADCVSNNPLATNLRNLVEDNSCSPALSGDPQLGPLADNGGATQTYALLPGSPATITIVKDALPNSATNFRFTGGLGSFYLDDISPQDGDNYGSSKTFVMAPGAYTVAEIVPDTWSLAGIACTPGSNTSVNLPLNRVTIRVVAGEHVTCTFNKNLKATFNTLVYHDLNEDRSYTAGEPGLPDWNVRIYDSYDAGYVEEEETAPTATRALFLPLIHNTP